MKGKEASFFWPSYADLMTSLFFVMLVLYVLTVAILKSKESGIIADALKYRKIRDIEQALKELDGKYFRYEPENQRFRMNVDVNFPPNSAAIQSLPTPVRDQLETTGNVLFDKIKAVSRQNPDVSYMIVIEGNAQRYNDNFRNNPNLGYTLSYERALALFNFWKAEGIDLGRFKNCEVVLVGSGYFGKARDRDTERNNRRFTIQVTSKVGKF